MKTDTVVSDLSLVLRPHDAARVLGVARQTLARWRCEGQGPAFVKLGARLVGYRRTDLDAWLASRSGQSTIALRAVA